MFHTKQKKVVFERQRQTQVNAVHFLLLTLMFVNVNQDLFQNPA